jgi:formylmethanofuran dehydrogenase subunit A
MSGSGSLGSFIFIEYPNLFSYIIASAYKSAAVIKYLHKFFQQKTYLSEDGAFFQGGIYEGEDEGRGLI